MGVQLASKKSSKKGLVIAAFLAAALGGGGFFVYTQVLGKGGDEIAEGKGGDKASTDPAAAADAGDKAGTDPAAAADAGGQAAGGDGAASGDAGSEAVAGASLDAGAKGDAGSEAVAGASPDAGQQPDSADAGTAVASGELSIESTPKGARVFLDGSEVGKTPYQTTATGDTHRLALVLNGHKLHLEEIKGAGAVTVELAKVGFKPTGQGGGFKIRCKKKKRYRVFIDGVDTGVLCPTKRLRVPFGDHKVEIYDPITEQRSSFSGTVKTTSRSERIYVD
ncbi:MAG: PEGA domain-containing protein [Deltaproteobacteria bacterium]|nr:PEGA domain-containing protein [Deltaproteobacteria bacterium]